MEDILEEIVGSILDEYDADDPFIQREFDDSIIMDGLTPLEKRAKFSTMISAGKNTKP